MVEAMLELNRLHETPALKEQAAKWFSEKWGIPYEAYLESIEESIRQQSGIAKYHRKAECGGVIGVPRWYILTCGKAETKEIVAGAGIIENDFHDRRDLTPNLCALFVEKEYRNSGVARCLLDVARSDMKACGFSKLYLVTDHTEFYEKCGWRFLTMVHDKDGVEERMYEADTEISEI